MTAHYIVLFLFLPCVLGQNNGVGRENLPYYTEIPSTNFRCEDQPYAGYYADPEAECQLFHICVRRNNLMEQYSFLCPNETVFHQERMVCVWWDGFDCPTAPSFYSVNEEIFEASDEERRGRQFTGNSIRPRGRSFQNDNQIDSFEGNVVLDEISAPPLGKSLNSPLNRPSSSASNIPKSLFRSKIATNSASNQNTNLRTTGKTLSFASNSLSKDSRKFLNRDVDNTIQKNKIEPQEFSQRNRNRISSVKENKANLRTNAPKINSSVRNKQLLNNIARLPFAQLTSPFQINVPVGQPRLITPISNVGDTTSNRNKFRNINQGRDTSTTTTQRTRSNPSFFKEKSKISTKDEKKRLKKVEKNIAPKAKQAFGISRGNNIANNRSPIRKNKIISNTFTARTPKTKTTTSPPRRSYLPTTQTKKPSSKKKPKKNWNQKSISHSRSRSQRPSHSSFKGSVSSYDILHELLKNITVIRSEALVKPNFRRNKRLDTEHSATIANKEVKENTDPLHLFNNDKFSDKKNVKKTSKCVYNSENKTFTGCLQEVNENVKIKSSKRSKIEQNQNTQANKGTSSYVSHTFSTRPTLKTKKHQNIDKIEKKLTAKKVITSRGKKKFSVEKFLKPLKIDISQLSRKSSKQ